MIQSELGEMVRLIGLWAEGNLSRWSVNTAVHYYLQNTLTSVSASRQGPWCQHRKTPPPKNTRLKKNWSLHCHELRREHFFLIHNKLWCMHVFVNKLDVHNYSLITSFRVLREGELGMARKNMIINQRMLIVFSKACVHYNNFFIGF